MTVTIGSLQNVPDPGSPIASPWAQDATRLGVHRFATKAALDTAVWPGLTNGNLAITLDTNTLWTYKAGAWVPGVWNSAWGILAEVRNASANQTLSATGYTDMNIASVNLRIDRHYKVSAQFNVAISAAGSDWGLNFHLNTTPIGYLAQCDATTHGGFGVPVSGSIPFKVAGTGLFAVRVHATEQAGTGTAMFVGAANTPRAVWVEDIGPAI